MAIKSKKWYENQIKCLENAAKNTGKLIYQPRDYEYGTEQYYKEMEFTVKENVPIQNQCKKIYDALNELRAEYNLYYRN